MKIGRVYITGAGPGEEKLISVRALELIKRADVIVYDRLGAERFLMYSKKECEKINAGKQPQNHRLNQSQINEILIQKAKEGKSVVRLKGGDPFVFGRGGEECEELEKAGIPFEVVPGISSFYSVCAYAGIPVTHRECASSFHVFTGHRVDNGELDYASIAHMEGTLVFLMSMKNLYTISEKLIQQGKSENTPVCAIQWGTTSRQRSVTANLKDIAQKAEQQNIGHPSVVIMGDVVKQKMNWQKYRPLFGKHIVLAASGETAFEAKELLQEEGAEVTIYSGIEIKENRKELSKEIKNLKQYTWIFFTSVNSVECFFEAMQKQKKDIRQLQGIGIFCVGEKTKQAVEKRGIFVDRIPEQYNSKSAAKDMERFIKKEDSILFPASELASTILEQKAQELGVTMVRVTAYQNHINTNGIEKIKSDLKKGNIDAIAFFSSSQAKNLYLLLGEDMKKCQLFAIGEQTQQSILQMGAKVKATAEISTGKGVAKKIIEVLKNV